jgi:hypothetical protein
MKKITNKKLQAALLRGAVLLAGSVCTICAMVFCESIYGFILTTFVGGGITAAVLDQIQTK